MRWLASGSSPWASAWLPGEQSDQAEDQGEDTEANHRIHSAQDQTSALTLRRERTSQSAEHSGQRAAAAAHDAAVESTKPDFIEPRFRHSHFSFVFFASLRCKSRI